MIERLPRVIEATSQGGVGGPDHPIRKVTRQVAFERDAWTKERAAKVVEVFDGLASSWHERARPGRLDALVDALDRGGAPTGGTCVELGSGTGFAT